MFRRARDIYRFLLKSTHSNSVTIRHYLMSSMLTPSHRFKTFQDKGWILPDPNLFCTFSLFFLQEPSESVVVPHNYSCELLPEQTDPEEVDSKAGYWEGDDGMMGTGSKPKMVGIRRKSSGCSWVQDIQAFPELVLEQTADSGCSSTFRRLKFILRSPISTTEGTASPFWDHSWTLTVYHLHYHTYLILSSDGWCHKLTGGRIISQYLRHFLATGVPTMEDKNERIIENI